MAEKIVRVIKFLLFLILIPLIVGMTTAFSQEILQLSGNQISYFLSGIISYIVFHLFVYEPEPQYQYGKNLVSEVFRFFGPLVAFVPLVLPIYSILLLILFYFTSIFFKGIDFSLYYLFLIGATFTMHIIFTAHELRGLDASALKANYFFSMTFVFIASLAIVVVMLNLIFPTFSFFDFFKDALQISESIYSRTFSQLFIP